MSRVALVAPVLFLLTAWPALEENSGTYDEPYHLASGYTYVTRGDFRLGPEHPPLVKEILGLTLVSLAPRIGADAERMFTAALERPDVQYIFGDRFLYGDNRPQPLLWRTRAVVLALAMALVLLVAVWARDAFGAVGGAVAAGVAAFDPNLLAHGTLATTDLGFTLFFFAALFLVRRMFRVITVVSAIATGVALGAAFASKHSAMLLVPAVAALGLARLIDATPWPVGDDSRLVIATARGRTTALLALFLLWCVVSWSSLWACYGFRYAASPNAGASLPLAEWTRRIRSERVLAEILARGEPTPDDGALARAVDVRPPLLSERVLETAARYRLVPEGYLFGLAVASALAQIRNDYLLGAISFTGWTWYFPFALLVKTPTATLLMTVAAVLLLVTAGGAGTSDSSGARQRREATFLVVAAAVVLAGTMTSSVNIGYRHVLPIVPLLCVLVGYAPAELERRYGRRAAVAFGSVACLLVAAEALAARPFFLPFFNAPAGGARGGVRLLSDSNLDWGQGLPALRRWMAAQHVARVNLCYFGSADPAAYGVDFVPLAGSNFGDFDELGTVGYAARTPVVPGYVAIGATHLQGTYLPPDLRQSYAFLRAKEPVAVPGGSTYIYWVDRWGE
ncbi:MAG: phospholipid carrier-dependent glycosyltransferase [Deltaproteobacteria bacterium]|nr:phospholipid carrier-dependent glycosyltransferase [Deltaproteobacteria bacterium]